MSNLTNESSMIQSPAEQILPENGDFNGLAQWALAAGRAAIRAVDGATAIVFYGSALYVIAKTPEGKFRARWSPVLTVSDDLYDDEIEYETQAEALRAVISDFEQSDEDIEQSGDSVKLNIPPVAVISGVAVPLAA